MKRIIDFFLLEWKKTSFQRKPLLLRGARQVGKTHAARVLGATFEVFVEINLELDPTLQEIFSRDVNPQRIIQQLSQYLKTDIIPGTTLLFIDEIQTVPQAITALRYFYEKLPTLHVIAAGSLMDFALEQVGMPVGRVSSLYLYPMSFVEFLVAAGEHRWAQLILDHAPEEPLLTGLHHKLLELVGIYMAIGGMPAAVNAWLRTQSSRTVRKTHQDLLDSYQQDFNKYAAKHQLKYLDLLFRYALVQLGRKFIYSKIGEYQKRELEPALGLLQKAGLLHPIFRTSGQGIPLGAGIHLDDFKIMFFDVGLSQALLQRDITSWFINPLEIFVNKGELTEVFIGQEILAYADPIAKQHLFYWRREQRNSQAEIDYLIQLHERVVPIEVKAGMSEQLKSMSLFLDSHPHSPYGIHLSARPFNMAPRLHTYPLYAVAKLFFDNNDIMRKALSDLVRVKTEK